ncbi:LysM peptidoglycan-binding domain-containing protein [Kineococcus arenarius]|uniref:LysM peptidoglycan-binding domain-containing protein n=1 Tax=Kineococcus sp. SYSU DK007 TaxID=3383128 RepID=UPI003D7CED48
MSSTALALFPAACRSRESRPAPVARCAPAARRARSARPAARRGPGRRPLRLTRRGRLSATCTAAGVLAGVVLAVSAAAGEPAAAGGAAGAAPHVVTVLPGQTLSQIAAELAPGEDWREVAAAIAEVNGLASQALRAGQRLTLPELD